MYSSVTPEPLADRSKSTNYEQKKSNGTKALKSQITLSVTSDGAISQKINVKVSVH